MANEDNNIQITKFVFIDPYSDLAINKLQRYEKLLNKITINNDS